MARRQSNKKKNSYNQPNLYGMVTIVMRDSMNKGQLIPATIGLILIILIMKYPNDKLPELVDKILGISLFNSILGWCFAILITFVAFYITKRQRRIHTKEIKRISEEKKKLQDLLSQRRLGSSNT